MKSPTWPAGTASVLVALPGGPLSRDPLSRAVAKATRAASGVQLADRLDGGGRADAAHALSDALPPGGSHGDGQVAGVRPRVGRRRLRPGGSACADGRRGGGSDRGSTPARPAPRVSRPGPGPVHRACPRGLGRSGAAVAGVGRGSGRVPARGRRTGRSRLAPAGGPGTGRARAATGPSGSARHLPAAAFAGLLPAQPAGRAVQADEGQHELAVRLAAPPSRPSQTARACGSRRPSANSPTPCCRPAARYSAPIATVRPGRRARA